MSSNDVRPAPKVLTRSPALSWSYVLGLGALALLWPLLELTGIAEALGDPVTTALLLVVVGGVWVGAVGLGGAPRPVATLTLTGTVYGALVALFALALGLGRELQGAATLYALVPLGICTVLRGHRRAPRSHRPANHRTTAVHPPPVMHSPPLPTPRWEDPRSEGTPAELAGRNNYR